MSEIPTPSAHIPLRKLWRFRSGVQSLDLAEHIHLFDCEQCRGGFRACIRTKSFEDARKEVGDSN